VYLSHFGFREPPFNLTPDPKFFFDSHLHREAWAALFYGIKEKKGFVVLTGEVGTGKTTLLRKVLRSLEATHRSVFIFNTLVSADELLESIVRDLDIEPAPGRVAMFQQFNDFLLDEVKKGHTVSVLIDEAQNLDEESLESVRLFSNLETDREKLLQIVLVGQPELDAKLNSRALRQLKQRVSLWCRLERLDRADTAAYINHRVAIAGYDGPSIFTAEALQAVWEQSGGIPRLINTICDNSLVTAFAMSKKSVAPDIIFEAVRDLRLTAVEQGNETARRERIESAPPTRKNPEIAAGHSADRAGYRIVGRGESAEQIRPAYAPAAQAVGGLGADPAPGIAAVPRIEPGEIARPQPSPPTAVELREVHRNGAAAVAEKPLAARESFSGYRSAAGSRSPGLVDDRVVSALLIEEIGIALADAMGPMAYLLLREKAADLGESWHRFPLARLAELIREVKTEILNDQMRAAFEERVIERVMSQFHGHSLPPHLREPKRR
jgi:general secretion pathway protein A